MTFAANEIEYLNSQPLGRLATVSPEGRPHIAPDVAFAVDDLASVDPSTPRGIDTRDIT